MIKITFLDGGVREFESGIEISKIAEAISPSLKKKCVAAKVNDELVNFNAILNHDANLVFITQDTNEAFEILNHSTAHLLAHAVSLLYPHAKMGVGPAIEEGFYYDFDLGDSKLEPADLVKIEKKMLELSNRDIPIIHYDLLKEEAKVLMKDDPYKLELIDAVSGDYVHVYEQDGYKEICKGPHLLTTKKMRFFKLLNIAGAYWRGDSKNKMLTRIYGTSWFSDEKLKEHLKNLEDRKQRDHRRIGRDLDLFMFSDFGPGLPFWLPNGMLLKNALIDFWTKVHTQAGYHLIQTPIILNRELWETSGHWFNYKENMYTTQVEENEFAIKPMNCPGGMLVYKNAIHSYRDFPLRLGELGLVHRHEASGALNGLFRVRTFTQDDAHIFMTEEQIRDEIANIILLFKKVYEVFNLNFHIELSTRPEDKFIGEISTWDTAETALAEACIKAGFDYKLNPGDGAFYGPKLDFKLRDSMNRIWQCGTIQLDMNLPERFDLTYVAEDGSKKRPVMVHRALFGSLERFIAILTEHFGGLFPLWLAPIQVRLIPVSADIHGEHAKQLCDELIKAGIRCDLDNREEKLGYRMREAQLKKIPLTVVVGDNEVINKTVTYRKHGTTEQITVSVDEFISLILESYPKN